MNPWAIHLWFHFIRQKFILKKSWKKVEVVLSERTSLRNKVQRVKMKSDIEYITIVMHRHVKYQRYEKAAVLRDKILFLQTPTV